MRRLLTLCAAVCIVSPCAGQYNFQADPNCLAVWNFDTGALLTDSKDSMDLTNSGADTNALDYQQGTASAYMDGTNQSMYIGDGSLDPNFPQKSGDTTHDLSFTGWVKLYVLPAAGDYHYIIDKMGGNQLMWAILLQNDAGTTSFKMWIGYNNGNSNETFVHGTGISANVWYHLGCTYDRSTKDWVMRIWDENAGALLGGSEASGTGAQTWCTGEGSSVYLGIGQNVGPSGEYWHGLFDQFGVFNDILSSDDIDGIRTSGAEAQTANLWWWRRRGGYQ